MHDFAAEVSKFPFLPLLGSQQEYQSPSQCRQHRGRKMSRKPGCKLLGFNGSTWSTAKEVLETCASQAAVLFGQEHRLDEAWRGEVQHSLLQHGWASAMTSAARGAGGGLSAGTFIVVPRKYGVAYVKGHSTWDHSPAGSEGRVCACWSPLLQRGGVVLISVYLWHGEGMSVRNLSILGAVAALVKESGSNWILQMDANMTPQEVASTGWIRKLSADVISRTGMGMDCEGRDIDFFCGVKRLEFKDRLAPGTTHQPPHTPAPHAMVQIGKSGQRKGDGSLGGLPQGGQGGFACLAR